MLSMHQHKYLPNDKVKDFIVNGVAANNVKIVKVINVIRPELVIRYEKKWLEMSARIKGLKPTMAYHGTLEANIPLICEKGLLVPGKDNNEVKHVTDEGWYGKGIYLSPDAELSVDYCRGKLLLVCSVLMGNSFNCGMTRMDGQGLKEGYDSHIAEDGMEYVIFDEAQVLCCYVVEFSY